MALIASDKMIRDFAEKDLGQNETISSIVIGIVRTPFWALLNGLLGAMMMKQVVLALTNKRLIAIILDSTFNFIESYSIDLDEIEKYKKKTFGINNMIDFKLKDGQIFKYGIPGIAINIKEQKTNCKMLLAYFKKNY